MTANSPKLTIEIQNKTPVELLDLSKSMMSIAEEYKNFSIGNKTEFPAEGVKLYVREIRAGSIITDLVALAPCALPFIENANIVIEYAKYLKILLNWFSGKSETKPEIFEKNSLQNISNIVEPIAKDQASQMNVSAINISGYAVVNFNISSTEANAAQNSIRRHIETMKEPITGIHEQVVMHWAQARNSANSKSGDKAKIESLYRGDVKVMFANATLKQQMLLSEPYPFNKAYVVDVAVETVNDKPALYRVLNLHEAITLDS